MSKVIASYGHFTKLDDLQQINFDNFNIKYKVNNQKVVKQMRDSIKQAREVIIATDDDREGEAIGWTICQFCNLDVNKTKKLRFKNYQIRADECAGKYSICKYGSC